MTSRVSFLLFYDHRRFFLRNQTNYSNLSLLSLSSLIFSLSHFDEPGSHWPAIKAFAAFEYPRR
jgi:hypothetical protein